MGALKPGEIDPFLHQQMSFYAVVFLVLSQRCTQEDFHSTPVLPEQRQPAAALPPAPCVLFVHWF